MKLFNSRVIILILSAAFTHSVFAFNTSFMQYTPAYYFNETDWKMVNGNTQKALSGARDGTKVVWKNPKSGAWGYVIPSNTVSKNGTTCRTLKIFNSARNITNESTFEFCKIKGEWEIAS